MSSSNSSSNSQTDFDCDNCGLNYNTTENQYEVDDCVWCEDCYTSKYYPNNNKSNDDNINKCDFCNHTNNDTIDEGNNCSHQFCGDCFGDIIKFNKCPMCFEIINDDAEPNKEICKSCYREYNDCNCYYSNYNQFNINNEVEEIFFNALFIKYKNTINHKIIRKIINMFESSYGYKVLTLNEIELEDIKIEKIDDENTYKLIVPNINYKPNKPTTSNNCISYEFILEYYTPDELEEKTIEYIKENIHYFNPNCLFDNIKEGVYKYEVESEDVSDEEEEPEKIFDNECCPVCLEEYNDNKKVGCCGHTICEDCYNHIINSNKQKCPECRADWQHTYHIDSEKVEFELSDIQELCDNEDYAVLNDIIDIEGLCENVVNVDGYAHTLGYDDDEFIDDVKYIGESDTDYHILVRSD